ncbi:sensor histidine kinase [Caldimonas sp. KR1-144]|uniref:sensor histidine kinase n=1 Tax=Caldimonas sp. KR1-144 TaxID=3400911 RepID=UPI003BFC7E79
MIKPNDSLPRRLLHAMLMCLGVAVFLTALNAGNFAHNLAYSCTIGLSCGFIIDRGRRAMSRWVWRGVPDHEHARHHWPGWPGMTVVVMAGTLAGYTVGVAAGNFLTGLDLPMPWEFKGQGSIGTLTFSITIGAIATYLFWLRGRLAATHAKAEAAQRVAAETQLKLLESQLEPHMLFNTLANLRALIALDPPRAQAMLDRLIAFLRATLAASRSDRHALADEFSRIGDYLALMQVRMGDERLQVALELPADLAAQPVPPLLLQPLVENAIQHGLEPARAGGRLTVRAHRDADALVLAVHDTGVGLDPERPPAEGHGFGTHQVRERLAAVYGDRARFSLAPAAAGGTLATITLPLE